MPGYASLIGVTITLGGCQQAFIGLIGHYLARVFEEVKGRPLYLIKQMPAEPHTAPSVSKIRTPASVRHEMKGFVDADSGRLA